MRKKNIWLPVIAIMAIVAIGASAGLLTYFGTITTTVDVTKAVTLAGTGCSNDVCSANLNGSGGETLLTNVYTMSSQTSVDIDVEVNSTASDVAIESVTTEYMLESAAIPWLGDGYLSADFSAGREYVTVLLDNFKLGDLDMLDFEQYVTTGYPASVNILLDTDGDGEFNPKKDLTTGYLTSGVDDVLKIEWAYNPTTHLARGPPYTVSGDYNDTFHVFKEAGIINDSTNAWLYSEAPGNGVPSCDFNNESIANWKAGRSRGANCCYVSDAWYTEACDALTVDSNTVVYGIQIESLGWIAASDAQIKNIKVNGVARDTITIEADQDMDFDLEVKLDDAASAGQYSVSTQIDVK